MTVGVFANEKHFSKVWKKQPQKFQPLETFLPTIGKTDIKSSNAWKIIGSPDHPASKPWKPKVSSLRPTAFFLAVSGEEGLRGLWSGGGIRP